MRARSIEELISLKGRRALVTGANVHLGKEISYKVKVSVANKVEKSGSLDL